MIRHLHYYYLTIAWFLLFALFSFNEAAPIIIPSVLSSLNRTTNNNNYIIFEEESSPKKTYLVQQSESTNSINRPNSGHFVVQPRNGGHHELYDRLPIISEEMSHKPMRFAPVGFGPLRVIIESHEETLIEFEYEHPEHKSDNESKNDEDPSHSDGSSGHSSGSQTVYTEFELRLRFYTHADSDVTSERWPLDHTNEIILHELPRAQYIACITLFAAPQENEPPVSTSDMCTDFYVGEHTGLDREIDEANEVDFLVPILVGFSVIFMFGIILISGVKKYFKNRQREKHMGDNFDMSSRRKSRVSMRSRRSSVYNRRSSRRSSSIRRMSSVTPRQRRMSVVSQRQRRQSSAYATQNSNAVYPTKDIDYIPFSGGANQPPSKTNPLFSADTVEDFNWALEAPRTEKELNAHKARERIDQRLHYDGPQQHDMGRFYLEEHDESELDEMDEDDFQHPDPQERNEHHVQQQRAPGTKTKKGGSDAHSLQITQQIRL